MWNRVFARIEHVTFTVIAVLKGAAVGGGLELTASAHLRVAEPGTI
jgi:enoyl-CoA hydratase/carnithine racemase